MLTSLLAAIVFSDPDLVQRGYVRTVNRTDGVSISQTQSCRFTAPGKPDLWLVGVAHIGLRKYYTDLQTLLDAQGVVLYEGVRSSDKQTKMPSVDPHGPKNVYQVLSGSIGLDFQLADIQYNRANWMNSDVTIGDMEKMKEAAGKGKKTELDHVVNSLRPGSEEAKQAAAFFKTATPGIKEALKIFLVDQLSKIDLMLPGQSDPLTIKIILDERNKSVERVFSKTVNGSPAPTSIAIFYGAEHQPEIQKNLSDRYGYKLVERQWFTFAKADRKKMDVSGRQFLKVLESASAHGGFAGLLLRD